MAELVDLDAVAFATRFIATRFREVRVEAGGWTVLCPCCDGEARTFISRAGVVSACPNGHTPGEITEAATPPPAAPTPSVSVALEDFFASCDDKIEWLHEPYVFRGGFTLIQGAPKSGKTWFAAWLAVCVAMRGHTTLFVEEEGAKETLRDRLLPFVKNPKGLRLYVAFRKRFRLDSQKSVETLIAEVRATGAALVVLDPFVALHSKREKEQDEMSAVLGAIRELITATGCAVALLHHTRKGESWNKSSSAEAQSEDARGSGVLAGEVDQVLAVKGLPIAKRRDGEVRFYVENPDTRIGAPFPRKLLGFRLEDGTMAEFGDEPGGEDATALLARLLPLLPEPPQFVSRDRLREALRVRAAALREAVQLGCSNGSITESGKGRLSRKQDPSGTDAGRMRTDGRILSADPSHHPSIGTDGTDGRIGSSRYGTDEDD